MIFSEEQWNDLFDYRESLEHHGVKGQKHGERRGPPYPLSANQKKYGKAGAKMDDEKKKLASEKAQERREARAEKHAVKAKTRSERRAAAAKARSEHNEEQAKKRAERKAARAEQRRRDILNSPRKLYKHRREFTKAEIDEAMKQFKWEEELSNYSTRKIENGSNFVKHLMNYTTNAIGLYNNAARIINSVTKDPDINLPTIRPASDFYRKKDGKKDDKKDKTN